MDCPVFISDTIVRELLVWELTYDAVEVALRSIAIKRAVQNPRDLTEIPGTDNRLFTMPGYLKDETYGALACKIVTSFPENNRKAGIPAVLANIMLFDEETGQMQAVIGATDITAYRTAAASVVATKHLLKNKPQKQSGVLAILGSGTQGRIHAEAFQHFFGFREIRIWNRTSESALRVCKDLRDTISTVFSVSDSIEKCVKDADVVVTATNSEEAILKKEWLKEGVHINAVGVRGRSSTELELDIYKSAAVYVDSLETAKRELPMLDSVQFKGEIGGVISGLLPLPLLDRTTVFQSLGVAVEDCAMARMVFNLWKKEHSL